MSNPYKTFKVYLCEEGHVFPNDATPICVYCAEKGIERTLLIGEIKKIHVNSRWSDWNKSRLHSFSTVGVIGEKK